MLRTTLRSSQAEAVKRALAHDGFGLFHEQRVGKTLTACAIAAHRNPDRLLIISIKKGLKEFERQIETHVDTQWLGWDAEQIRFVNYERLWKARKELRSWMEEGSRSMVIIDESHRIKRRGSKFYKACRYICWKYPKYGDPIPLAKYRLLMTGTPIAQGIQDGWAQFDVMDPSVFGPWKQFRRKHLIMHGLWKSKVIGFRNVKRFNRLFHEYSHRKTLREARAQEGKDPMKIRTKKLYAKWSPAAQKAYTEIEKDLITIIQSDIVSAPLVITQVMKMQQISGGFVITDSRRVRQVGKMKLDLIEDLLRAELRREKCVIVARFIHEIRAIRRLAERLGKSVEVIAGGTEFSGRQTADVAIVQIASGVAIDLSASQHIIFYSWDYSYINFEQTKFRVLSFDTTLVNYYFLFVQDSIDEKIYQVVTGKQDVAKAVCDYYRRRHVRAPSSVR